MSVTRGGLGISATILLLLGAAMGLVAGRLIEPSSGWAGAIEGDQGRGRAVPSLHRLAADTAAAFNPDWDRPYPQSQPVGRILKPYPSVTRGEVPPQDLYLFGGAGPSSFESVDSVGNFEEFRRLCSASKPRVMEARQRYMAMRYDFSGRVMAGAFMTGGKPVPLGPVSRLPNGIARWEDLAGLEPEEMRRRDLFPAGFKPLSHPLQNIGHQLFPKSWTDVHPEHQRFDVDFDIPDAYLPEFPPPLFLTTRPDLGDVSRGYEITQANYRELFDGIITPEQLEGLRLLVTKFPTSWFNQTRHRVTDQPVRGTACFDCHVNGHANGAIALDPATRPTLLRTRVDTPSLRGNHNMQLLSSRRSIRSTEHFSEVEEYFDGDISLQPQVGGRQLDRASTNRMGDFNAIVAWPPAPKLDRFGYLLAARATPAELRGQALFHGKARCASCHPAPFFTDNQMHDLRVEEFYEGRAEGWIKTFALRGIRDSPPYLHDGRLPTLQDTVEFFNLVLGLRLTADEKADLTAFLLTL